MLEEDVAAIEDAFMVATGELELMLIVNCCKRLLICRCLANCRHSCLCVGQSRC